MDMNKQNLYSLQELKYCHFHVYQLPTYLAASSTEPQFQAPLPPLLSSGGIPLQLRQNDHQYTVTREENQGQVAFLQRLTFHCADHIPSCPSE